jgi:cyclic pyranopterin phosphate synthase
MAELSHVGADGTVRMVDVGAKPATRRQATAAAAVRFGDAATAGLVRAGTTPKGDVLATARLAGIMAAKRTSELIPLCHPIALDNVAVDLVLDDALPGVRITATASCRAATGVEMEALTAAAVAALTVVDMLKSADRWMTVEAVRLLEKSGGRHGRLRRPADGG